MRVGLIISGSLETISGSHLYARRLVGHLRSCCDSVEVFSLPQHQYARQLASNFTHDLERRVPAAQLDLLLQDEACHPALLLLNRQLRGRVSFPIVSLVHRLRGSEPHAPGAQEFYGRVERQYLTSVDAFVCGS